MTTLSFAHVALSCKDPIATEQFYSRHFSFRRARVIPTDDGQIVFIKTDKGDLYLELFPAPDKRPAPAVMKDGPGYPSYRHIAFKVDDVDAKIAEMGDDAKVTFGPFGFDEVIPGWRTVWIVDPDERIIEISQGYVDEENPPEL